MISSLMPICSLSKRSLIPIFSLSKRFLLPSLTVVEVLDFSCLHLLNFPDQFTQSFKKGLRIIKSQFVLDKKTIQDLCYNPVNVKINRKYYHNQLICQMNFGWQSCRSFDSSGNNSFCLAFSIFGLKIAGVFKASIPFPLLYCHGW